MTAQIFNQRWQELLLTLLKLDTQSPMETGHPSKIRESLELIAAQAQECGLAVAYFEAPPQSSLDNRYVPLTVKEAAASLGKDFFESQPSMVLRAGEPRHFTHTLVLNFHIDTVAGVWEPSFVDGRFIARGAADAKGPGLAGLAGIAHVMKEDPDIFRETQVLVHCVAGEEGGSMGVYGTRLLIENGYVGRLNVFAEPSGGVYFDSATSTMTARIEVSGKSSTDDAPADGDNASVMLAFICQKMAGTLGEFFEESGRRMCVGGLNTGNSHNRVYGSGTLWFNFAYSDLETAQTIESRVREAFDEAIADFERQFSSSSLFSRSAANASHITRLTWTKRRLPTLQNRDPEMERLLNKAGLTRCPPDRADAAFTCDAIWAQGEGRYAIVFGPGELTANRAHAEGEFIAVAELESYATAIATLVREFAANHSAGQSLTHNGVNACTGQ